MKYLHILLFLLLTVAAGAQENIDSVKVSADSVIADSTDTDTIDMPALALPWPQSAQKRIAELLDDPFFQTTQVAVMAWDLTADSCIYRTNERQRLRPASTMKAVTAITALDFLGNDYSLRTELRYAGQKIDSTRTLVGDLYCVGGMDPMFGSDELNNFVDAVKELGIDTLRGNIYEDVSFKDKDRLGNGWCWDDDNPVLSPLLYKRKADFASRLRDALRNRGIVISGGTGEKRAPADSKQLCVRTHPLTKVMRRMLKVSDNLYAEAVFYQIAHREAGAGATYRSARRVIGRLINRVGLRAGDYDIADGSGLSLYNYVSAELEVKLLRYAYQHKAIYDALYPLLPIAGVDGSLHSRMKGSLTRGNVHAKTGTVEGIRSLCGYLTAKNGHVVCFSIINQGVPGSYQARLFQDRVCTALCR